MRWLLLVLALFSGVGYSRSGPHIDADTQQDQSQAVQRGSDQFPVAVKILPSHASEKKATEEEKHWAESAIEERRLSDATYALVFVTGALAFFTGGLWLATYRLARDARDTSVRQAGDTQQAYALAEKQMVLIARQVDLAEKQHGLEQWQYLTTHRPKLIIRRISLHEGTEGTSSAIGRCTKIQFIIANVGGSRATILESNATFARVDGILPAIPPYSTATNTVANTVREAGQSDPPEALIIEDTETLQVIRDWQGKTITNGEQCPYFIIGYVQYADDMDTVRRVAFCRRYNPATKRFIRVDDPEYEYAD